MKRRALWRVWSMSQVLRWVPGGTDGSSVVETAMSALVLFTVVLGIIETSIALYAYHFTSEVAREATRYAIVRGSSCTYSEPGCPAQASDIQNFVRGLTYPGLDPSAITVTTTWPTTGASCSPSSNPCNNPGNLVSVTVQYQFLWSIPLVPANTLKLTSSSEMVISQ
jgi:Flp pilus assembly protein TadG